MKKTRGILLTAVTVLCFLSSLLLLSGCDFLDSINPDSTIIPNAVNNFSITQKDDTQTITVNWSKYSANFQSAEITVNHNDTLVSCTEITDKNQNSCDIEVFYGSFEVTAVLNINASVPLVLQQTVAVTSDEYNLCAMNATFPLAYFATSIWDINSIPTFVYIERSATFEWNALPENIFEFPQAITGGTVDFHGVRPAVREWIKELYELDKSSKFNLYCTDNYPELFLEYILFNKIPEDNYKFTMLSDGTGTAYHYGLNYGGENGKTDFDNRVTALNSIVSNVKAGQLFYLAGIPYSSGSYSVLQGYTAAMLTLPNVTQWVEDIDTLRLLTKDAAMLAQLETFVSEGKIIEKKLNTLIENVRTNGHLEELEYLLKLKWNDGGQVKSINDYFNNTNGKKTLLILGTRTTNEYNNYEYDFEEYVDKIFEVYGSEYNIFYKGHPGSPTYPDTVFEEGTPEKMKQDYFAENGIIDIPATIPAEFLMYLYPDVYVCGFSGTTFLSATEGQILAIFGSSSSISNTIINDSTLNLFTDTYFIYKSEEEMLMEQSLKP